MEHKKAMIVHKILLIILVTFLFGFAYVAVQQSYRMSANDPQIQLSEDSAEILGKGQNPQDLVPGDPSTDMAKSLAPFIIIYDDSGKVAAASAQLDGKTPSLPDGVLDYAKSHSEDRFTWQPKSGAKETVRMAAVLTRYNGDKPGYVLVGRSLREVENRINMLGLMAIIAWAASVAVIILASLLGLFMKKRSEPSSEPTESETHSAPLIDK